MRKRVLVSGGCGFIGSYFVELLLEKGYYVINVDKITYAARKDLNFEKYKNYNLFAKFEFRSDKRIKRIRFKDVNVRFMGYLFSYKI